eukprot:TRINITY_DN24356_c0_g1_i1.p1 TRINITY_DN24356_c0_g1~~TRINITY_DN24356_c0_g1_i1.p1  ORF type:complete len:1079 (-),score=209.77 TRINITY_DN24356_c0_g1_i1:461-3697(-)
MAENEWINGYLEAILDTGNTVNEHRSGEVPSVTDRDVRGSGDKLAAKYFVDEVTGYDEKSLYNSWMKTTVARNGLSRRSRLENMCWRIWHLARRKKQVEWENTKRFTSRRLEEDQSRTEVIEDMSEDLSEGEKADGQSQSDSSKDIKLAVSTSDAEGDRDSKKDKRLYMVLISLHGLVRGDNMELGRDSDTGGQVKYVVELARALSKMPEVYRVDLLTRQICAPEVDWSYGEPTEMLTPVTDENSEVGESSGAYIVRIPCGRMDKYISKELLWPNIQEFVDGALSHILNMAKVLGDQVGGGDLVWPHVIHGHYADAGDIASLLSGALNVPMVLTGHSLGRNKLEQLLKQGRQSQEDINSTYKITRRIEAEELALDAAELVITSTRQEIEEQWGTYDGFDVKLEVKLRARARRGVSCHGRYMPRMVVIPPGMDFSNVIVQDAGDVLDDVDSIAFTNSDGTAIAPLSPRADPPIWLEIMKFFTNPHKPMILALARPDPKKNITTLLKAFGSCRPLRELANLTLIMGNREDIEDMSSSSASVLSTVLRLVDKHDLYGQVAYPKHHKQSEVPDIYRLAAKTKGVFINPALVEPFGLTLIEAAAHGLPMVATENGGPVDIHRTLSNGLLVDPHDETAIAEALLKLVADRTLWTECRRNGLKNIHSYSWPEHCRTYLSKVAQCRGRHPQWQSDPLVDCDVDVESQGDSLTDIRDLRLSTDGERAGSLNSSAVELLRSGSGKDLTPEVKFNNGSRRSLGKLGSMHEDNGVVKEGRQMHGHVESNGDNQTQSKGPMVRKRRRLVVVAVDSYDSSGELTAEFINTLEGVLKDLKSRPGTGVVLSTALTISEVEQVLEKGGIPVTELDAVICSSGAEIYYPCDPSLGGQAQLCVDPDYDQHVGYRWGGEGLKKSMSRFISSIDGDKESKKDRALTEDEQRTRAHCLAYTVTNPSVAPTVAELRTHLRRRGLRCHVVYCRAATKLHLLPLLASRSQAMRYVFVRWGVELVNMFFIMGGNGDTDYEEMLSGAHKTVVLDNIVQAGSDKLLRVGSGCARDEFVSDESENLVHLAEFTTEGIRESVRNFGWK